MGAFENISGYTDMWHKYLLNRSLGGNDK